jgi:hypothetical protein
MSRSDRRARAIFAMVALASLAGIVPVSAHTEEARQRPEHRSSEAERAGARRAAEAHRSHPVHPASAHEYPLASEHRQMATRSVAARSEPRGAADQYRSGEARMHEVYRRPVAGQLHVVRYGNGLSGTVERPIRPGFISRTFVSGGHVLYAHVYQRQVWYHFGRAIAYETFVPAVRYPAVYYSWALTAWPHPVSFAWGWQVQPWYPVYGARFTPYPVYTSPDLWMTDYIIAQSMQTAYQAQTGNPAWSPSQQGTVAPVPEPDVAAPAAAADEAAPAAPTGDVPAEPQPGSGPSAPAALPPAITPQIKAQLNAQIKVQLQEQETAAALPLVLTTQSAAAPQSAAPAQSAAATASTPPALRPNHVFFQVVQPLEVPSGAANRYCSLSANDYIKRTGGMSNEDWMIPVVVELSGPGECPQGLETRIGLNDLNAMENEQEALVMEAMQAASRSMGPNGPPSGPGVHPTLIVDGSAAPDPGVLDAIRQAR